MIIREHCGSGDCDVAYVIAVSGTNSGRWEWRCRCVNLGIRHSDLKIGPSK
jgi:hypothetical protein